MARPSTGGTPSPILEELISSGHGRTSLTDSTDSASHSFISKDFCRSSELPIESTSEGLTISTPLGKTIVVGHFCLSYPGLVGETFLPTDLFMLPISDFDIILGMDWLVEYHAMLDFSAKTVMFCIPGLPQFQFVAEPRGESLSCLMFCAVEEPVTASVEKLPVVYDFPDVFWEILGLPPPRHIEF
ncbi:uncharacterized protein LOC131218142 [Magnolia sinica]|uniref:uncharacterized protein LOC131218142 n=1 Tax=Magnolia sinica TaxID=86752 RepID=UPI002659A7A6|nr:uncharacterized protein LOC131218142 [Magnolia sinica]